MITDLYDELNSALPAAKTASVRVAYIFLVRMVPYGNLYVIRSENF